MTTKFGQLVAQVAQNAGKAWTGTASSGSTTTLLDTTFRLQESDGFWTYGTLVIDSTTDGLAPLWEVRYVTDFVYSSKTFTVSPAFSATITTGDTYLAIHPGLPMHVIKQSINRALDNTKRIIVDTATVTLVDNDTEYTLVADAGLDLRKVWIATETGTANNEWREIDGWSLQLSPTVGSPPTLIIPLYYAVAGYTLKYEYAYPHPQLTTDTSLLDETIQREEIVYPATLFCLQWLKQEAKTNDYDESLAYWRNKVQELELTVAKRRLPKAGKKFFVTSPGDFRRYPGDRTPR